MLICAPSFQGKCYIFLLYSFLNDILSYARVKKLLCGKLTMIYKLRKIEGGRLGVGVGVGFFVFCRFCVFDRSIDDDGYNLFDWVPAFFHCHAIQVGFCDRLG